MARGRVAGVLIICVMLLTMVLPHLAAADAIDQPINDSPLNAATEIGPGHTFVVTWVADGDGDVAYAVQWQWRTPTGSYALPLYDTGIIEVEDLDEPGQMSYPEGVFAYGGTYYWHMRVQNNHGQWSAWSAETNFTVIVNSPPGQPENFEPDAGATGVPLPVTLEASEFRDPNAEELVLGEKDTHTASQWQVTTTSGNYSSPVFNSGAGLTSITIPLGTLSENATYYWHVRYQDSYGNWSAYSAETSFTTGTELIKPTNLAPYDGATEIGPSFVFQFSYPDPAPYVYYGKRVQYRTADGNYNTPLFDSGFVLPDEEEVYPAGLLAYGETYYWRVKIQDDRGYWTPWSDETSFTVIANLPPSQPENFEPNDGATGVSLPVTLAACEFRDPNAEELVLGQEDTHAASQWQVTTTSGNYSSPVFNSGAGLTSITIPLGTLSENATYYWHVSYQDSYGNWSAYSPETSFTTGTTTVFTVQQPVNVGPLDGAIQISPDEKLKASDFEGSEGRTHLASWWQVTRPDARQKNALGDYEQPLFDSRVDMSNKVQISVPVGLLDYDKTYYWHVKYQDDTGAWSAWSAETSFTVVKNLPPSSPRNVEPLEGKTGVATDPVLMASDFSDYDATAYMGLTDSHAGSQWQVTDTAGNYASPEWDSGAAGPTTSAAVPKGHLLAGAKYYWHVRYQDSRGNWSGYSQETSFTTKALSDPVPSFVVDKTDVVAGRDLVTFTDNSTPVGEIDSWSWDFGDETTETWTDDTRPPNGEISHKYVTGGTTYTAKLTVYNGAKPAGVEQTVAIVVHAVPVAGFTMTPAAPKAGKEITFTDTSTATADIESWEWQFDDGSTETWNAANPRPANGQITHKFKKGGEHAVSLIVKGKGDLGESIYNKKMNVRGAGGFQFGLWMVAVGVGVVVVIAGAVYLLRARKGK